MPDSMSSAEPSVHDQAAAALLDPYLTDDPPDGWHLIDNADADDVRHALEVAIGRMRAVLRQCERAPRIRYPGDDGCTGRVLDAHQTAWALRGDKRGWWRRA